MKNIEENKIRQLVRKYIKEVMLQRTDEIPMPDSEENKNNFRKNSPMYVKAKKLKTEDMDKTYCEECGKEITDKDFETNNVVYGDFTPDSYHTSEHQEFFHKKCAPTKLKVKKLKTEKIEPRGIDEFDSGDNVVIDLGHGKPFKAIIEDMYYGTHNSKVLVKAINNGKKFTFSRDEFLDYVENKLNEVTISSKFNLSNYYVVLGFYGSSDDEIGIVLKSKNKNDAVKRAIKKLNIQSPITVQSLDKFDSYLTRNIEFDDDIDLETQNKIVKLVNNKLNESKTTDTAMKPNKKTEDDKAIEKIRKERSDAEKKPLWNKKMTDENIDKIVKKLNIQFNTFSREQFKKGMKIEVKDKDLTFDDLLLVAKKVWEKIRNDSSYYDKKENMEKKLSDKIETKIESKPPMKIKESKTLKERYVRHLIRESIKKQLKEGMYTEKGQQAYMIEYLNVIFDKLDTKSLNTVLAHIGGDSAWNKNMAINNLNKKMDSMTSDELVDVSTYLEKEFGEDKIKSFFEYDGHNG